MTAPTETVLTQLNRHGFRLIMLLDVFGLYLCMVVLMWLRFGPDWPTVPPQAYFVSFAVATVIFTVIWYFGGLYERESRVGVTAVLPRAMRLSLVAGGVVALLIMALTGWLQHAGVATVRALPFPITNLVALIVIAAILVSFNRTVARYWALRQVGKPRVLLAGDAADRSLAREHLGQQHPKLEIVGEIGSPELAQQTVKDLACSDVMLVSPTWLDAWYPHIYASLDARGVATLMRLSGRETVFGLKRIREISGMPFVALQAQTLSRPQQRLKRLIDLGVLLGLAPVWIPVLLLVTLYQLVVAGRPLLFFQERVGINGKTFTMAKFRTMRNDAEVDGVQLSQTGDPRVIGACRWVRATRMDELPQLWNVLRGEMSLVGPRPERPYFTEGFEKSIPGYWLRHAVPPGLTGLAQIHARYHTSAEYKLGYDLQYVVNWSFVLDLEIMVRTVWVVLTRRV